MKQSVNAPIEIEVSVLAEAGAGGVYDVVVIKAGRTASANVQAEYNGKQVMIYKEYPASVIREADKRRVFENTPVVMRPIGEHLTNKDGSTKQILGTLRDTYFDEATGEERGKIHLKQGEGIVAELRDWFTSLWQKTKQIGLSIAAEGKWSIERAGNDVVAIVSSIDSMNSLDPVPQGNAGGMIVSLVESFITNNFSEPLPTNKMLTKKQLWDSLKVLEVIPDGWTYESATEDVLNALLAKTVKPVEALSTATPVAPVAPVAAPVAEPANAEPVMAEARKALADVQAILAEAKLTSALANSKLPEKAKEFVRENFAGKTFNEAELSKFMQSQQSILAEGAAPQGNLRNIEFGKDAYDKSRKILEWALISPAMKKILVEGKTDELKEIYNEYKDVRNVRRVSLRELYSDITGDKYFEGRVDYGRSLLSEAMTTSSWAEILGDSVTRSMVLEYGYNAYNDDWKKISNQVSRPDFRTNRITRMGGYGNLPAVAENAAYQALNSPGDEEATYAITKYGGIETITMEMIANDDMGAVQRIPRALAIAANRTKYEFVFDFINSTSNIYDGTELITYAHANKGIDPLTGASLSAAYDKMVNQTDMSSAKKIGIRPRYLVYAAGAGLGKAVYDLLTDGYGKSNIVPDYWSSFQIESIGVTHWTDANDWYLVADPNLAPGLEVGEWRGHEGPELFIQDLPTQGATFSNDQIKYKIRDIYGAGIVDYRAFFGAKVASGS